MPGQSVVEMVMAVVARKLPLLKRHTHMADIRTIIDFIIEALNNKVSLDAPSHLKNKDTIAAEYRDQ